MKRFPCFVLLAVAILSASFPAKLNATVINGTVAGPGGSGNVPVFGGNLAEPSLTYTSIDYLDVSITVDSAGIYDINEAPGSGVVHNTTGIAWSGFTWELIAGPPSAFVYDPSSPGFSSVDYSSTFANATGTDTFATYGGGTLPSGATFQPNFSIAVSDAGTFVIRETPIPIPEPSGLVLLAIGAAAVVGYRRRAHR